MPSNKIQKTVKLEVLSRNGLQRHEDETGQNAVKRGQISKTGRLVRARNLYLKKGRGETERG